MRPRRRTVDRIWIRRFELVSLVLGAVFWLNACSSAQVDRAPLDGFEAAAYQTYSWRNAPITRNYESNDPLYVIGPAVRAQVDAVLGNKGYRLLESGGEFVIDFRFKASLTDGALAEHATNIDPVPRTVINRMPDQASVDNAYALSGVREINTLLLRFEDGADQALVWAVSISKVVEDRNFKNPEKLQRKVEQAIDVALRPLPSAG